jgi:hypothetical protein
MRQQVTEKQLPGVFAALQLRKKRPKCCAGAKWNCIFVSSKGRTSYREERLFSPSLRLWRNW